MEIHHSAGGRLGALSETPSLQGTGRSPVGAALLGNVGCPQLLGVAGPWLGRWWEGHFPIQPYQCGVQGIKQVSDVIRFTFLENSHSGHRELCKD